MITNTRADSDLRQSTEYQDDCDKCLETTENTSWLQVRRPNHYTT